MNDNFLLLKNIAINNEQEDIYRLLDLFLTFTDDYVKPYIKKGVPDEDLRQECALIISEEVLSGIFLDKSNRRERLLDADHEIAREIYIEIIHDISIACDNALVNITDSEEMAKKACREVLAKVNVISEGSERFVSEYGINPTPAELAEFLSLDEETIIEAVELSGYEIKNIDFDTPIREKKT